MKKNEKALSVGKRIFLSCVVNGIMLITAGVFMLKRNIPCMTVSLIALLTSIAISLSIKHAKKEQHDEMSLLHLQEAGAITQEKMYRATIWATVVIIIATRLPVNLPIDWQIVIAPLFYVIIGANDLLLGLTFKKLEEA